jgi:tetratricopeptide (TPR) repeat protein
MPIKKKGVRSVSFKRNGSYQQGLIKRNLIIIISLFVLVASLAILLFLNLNTKNKLSDQWTAKGQNYLVAKNYPAAIDAFGKAIEADKKAMSAYIGMADTYQAMKEPADVEGILLDGIKAADHPETLYIRLSSFYEYQGFYEKAGEILDAGYVATQSADLWSAYAKLKTRINFYGNTPGNLIDGGFIASQGEWLYYANFSDHGYLYKMRVDNSEKQRLNTEKTSAINVIGDWIFYEVECVDPDGFPCHTISKIKTDGTMKASLSDEQVNGIYLVNGSIFYTDRSRYLLRLSPTKLLKSPIDAAVTYSFSVSGDWIYYADFNDGQSLYKIKRDGTMKTKILSDDVGTLNVVGDWIYYSSNLGGDAGLATNLNKVKTDGTSRTVLSDQEWTYEINVVDDWIYFSDYHQDTMDSYGKWTLYRMKTDGTGKTKLSDDNIVNVNIAGDWIYFTIRNDTAVDYIDPVLYRMKTDGTMKEIVTNPQ